MSDTKIKWYSQAFRRQVVREYEAGASIRTLRKKYGIGGTSTIQGWVKKYGTQGLRHELVRIQSTEEVDRVRELEARVQELERALGQVTLEKLALESALEVLDEEYGVDLKKNAPPSSSTSNAKPNSKAGSN
jgi:transposase